MPLLEVTNLVKHFTRKRGFLAPVSIVRAVDGVSFTIDEGEMFGLVGESGSGKTTTGRCILRLIEPTSGQVRLKGEDVLGFSRTRLRLARRDMQIVFQDPFSVTEPSHARGIDRGGTADHSPRRKLTRSKGAGGRTVPTGGSRSHTTGALPAPVQWRPASACRVGAGPCAQSRRSLSPTSPFPLSMYPCRRRSINLLMDLQQRLKLTYLFIAHDLRLVASHLPPGGGHVPGKNCGDGRNGIDLRGPGASLHARVAIRDSASRSGSASSPCRARSGFVRA